jgi:hypothetical protein
MDKRPEQRTSLADSIKDPKLPSSPPQNSTIGLLNPRGQHWGGSETHMHHLDAGPIEGYDCRRVVVVKVPHSKECICVSPVIAVSSGSDLRDVVALGLRARAHD